MTTTRLYEVPFLAQRADKIDARLYNLWLRARKRLGSPLRLELPGLRGGTELILEDRAWVCVNSRQYDLPLLAWVDFDDRRRDALHVPIPCNINYYHFAASMLRAKVLELMAQQLEEKLSHNPKIKKRFL